ncbi:NAD(P)/FAD-dependent oxidoreductase [Rhizobium sp. S152]|uniref:FAD-dependent oxidoreductase n=1 Tax=Rhizobium sp. S152 TaxID=3055038 RepID=UPI0025A9C042|nr:NAD(P)/FAD-dependent oxidoreductase [Rhizobium sp. S152]MDM9629748.1 NAD(P)/FAD-dependent oxidoreductase [Rhizobium sp. S152]
MKLDALDIAIAGAGIGGLSLAALLARQGARVTIYDQMSAPQPVGSGFVLQPTGAAVLSRMGLFSAVESRGARISRMHGRLSGNGRTVLDVGYRPGAYGIAIQRVALFDLLLEAAVKAGVRFETSSRVTGIEAGSAPRLVLEGGGTSAAADLVVDAMGANSPIETKVTTELGYGALWATVPWPANGLFRPDELEQRYRRASQMAGVLPVGTARDGAPPMATFFWSIRNQDHPAWKSAGRDAWLDAVRAFWPEAEALAITAEPVHARYRHLTRTPVAGRNTVKIGDAWHATSPQLGQGANMALLDAASLCSALCREATIGDAIGRHLKQREMHIRFYQLLSRVLTPFYQSDSRLLPLSRDIFIGPATKLPLVRSLITTLVTGELLDPVGRIGLDRLAPGGAFNTDDQSALA